MALTLTVLGNSSAKPILERNPSAHVLQLRGSSFLIDCGEGSQIQMLKTKIKSNKINKIFISHLHGDHYLGIFGFIFTQHLGGRTNDLDIYAPAELEKLIYAHIEVANTQLHYKLNFYPLPLEGGEIFENKDVKIECFCLDHRIKTYGFVFREKEGERRIKKEAIIDLDIPINEYSKIKQGANFVDANGEVYSNNAITIAPQHAFSYAYVSDTRYFEDVIPYIKEVDLLYHEATFLDEMRDKAGEMYHSTAAQAAMIAKKANVKQLMIGHFSARFKDDSLFVNEAKEVFPNTIGAFNGRVINLK